MIEAGDNVVYTPVDKDNNNYPIGRRGTAITSIYYLKNAPDHEFVDVVWDNEIPPTKPFRKQQIGHVVNVKNLVKIQEDAN